MACTSASAWFDGGHHRQVAGSISLDDLDFRLAAKEPRESIQGLV